MNINKSFIVKPHDDGEFIAEAFGIESGHNNVILNNIEIPDEIPKVTYITGESGCGKSTLLKEVYSKYIQKLEIPREPLFKWGKDEQETLKYLSLVGLGDAVLFMSYYDELSDSQQYRARLLLELLNDNEIIVLDEFLSTLDRKTAQSVAYCFQKAIRKTSKKIVVATAHDDLIDYLQPDLLIKGKAFPSRWEIHRNDTTEILNPYNDIIIKDEDKNWYRECSLGELHYKGKYTGGVKDYLAAYYNGTLVGLLIGIYRMSDGGRRISRLVVHPSYRGIGIGQKLVEEYISRYNTADVVAAMALYNPVFEKSGMKRVKDVEIKPPKGLSTILKTNKFDCSKWYSKDYCMVFMSDKNNRKILLDYTKEISYLVCPGGKYLEETEVEYKLINDASTSGRVLWNLRPRTMAKFIA